VSDALDLASKLAASKWQKLLQTTADLVVLFGQRPTSPSPLVFSNATPSNLDQSGMIPLNPLLSIYGEITETNTLTPTPSPAEDTC